MRTTLVIDDHLLDKAKAQALERGLTLSAVVNQALRAALTSPPAPPEQFAMTTYGDPQTPTHHEPKDFWAVQEEEDRSRVGS